MVLERTVHRITVPPHRVHELGLLVVRVMAWEQHQAISQRLEGLAHALFDGLPVSAMLSKVPRGAIASANEVHTDSVILEDPFRS